jgi:hypothetical protein
MPTRQRSYACIHPRTYKYFFERDEVQTVWQRLADRYGPISRDSSFGVMEIRAERFTLRAVLGGNPITVIRRRDCAAADVVELHELIGYLADDDDADAAAAA